MFVRPPLGKCVCSNRICQKQPYWQSINRVDASIAKKRQPGKYITKIQSQLRSLLAYFLYANHRIFNNSFNQKRQPCFRLSRLFNPRSPATVSIRNFEIKTITEIITMTALGGRRTGICLFGISGKFFSLLLPSERFTLLPV